MRINYQMQAGYTDVQIMPAMIGAVIIIGIAGQIGHPGFETGKDLIKLAIILVLGTCVQVYGFAMHIYCLGYPESPFNRHSSPVFMTLLCAGPMAFTAWKFYSVNEPAGFIVCTMLSLLVLVVTPGFALYRKITGKRPSGES